MKKSAQHSFYRASEETKQKELKIENEDLKLHLRKIKDTDRPINSSIPSDRVVMKLVKRTIRSDDEENRSSIEVNSVQVLPFSLKN